MALNETALYSLSVEEEIPDEALAADLVGFNVHGSQWPFFLVQTYTEIRHIQGLAYLLGPEQPVVAVNPPRGELREDFPRRDIAWSNYALERLDRLGYQGPWRLGGWSFGGAIALRLGKLLADNGQDVQSVVLFDTVCPDLSRSARRLRPSNPIHRLAKSVNEYFERPEEEGVDTLKKLVAAGRKRLGGSKKKRLVQRRDQMGFLQRAIHVAYLNYERFEFRGPVALLWTDETMKAKRDLSLGWHEYIRGPFFSQRVGEGHTEMWMEPHVQQVAQACEFFLACEASRGSAVIPGSEPNSNAQSSSA